MHVLNVHNWQSAEESQPAAKEKHNILTSNKSSTAEKDSNSLTSTSVYKSYENRHQHSEFSHLGTTTSNSRHPTLADESSNPLSAFKDEAGKSKGAGQNDTLMYASEFNTRSASKKSSAFKAAAAEAELDMLLDSVTEIKIFESTNVTDQSIRPYPVTHTETPTPLSEGTSSMQEVSTQPKRGRDLAKPVLFSLDDTLDDLLKETSAVTNKNEHSLPNEVNSIAGHTSSASQPVSKSKIIDDFDSWIDAL